MSKKKVASRSTMTLKDFHGGSIPSDLPLPSAPGMTVDRSVFERQGSGTWMSPTLGRGYSNDRSAYHRQGSMNSGVRTFEDKSSYFPNPANIGRNYDEDERKPVDNRPRSSHSADRFEDHASYDERRGGGGGGGYTVDRYALEDQAASFSEPPRGATASDRFPPSQVNPSGGFEPDIYVHDDFGLIPVGPPPSRALPPQDLPSRPQPSSYPRDNFPENRIDQSSPYQIPRETPSAPPPYSPSEQVAASPPRSWRNPSHAVQSPAAAASSQLPTESATNVWTARRDGGDFNKVQTPPEVTSDSLSSSPWRPHSTGGRAVDKISSGRWQPDSSRPSSGRWQTDSSREPVQYKPSAAEEPRAAYGAYGVDTARQSYAEDISDTQRYVGADSERVGHTGAAGRVPYVDSSRGHNVDDGRPDVDQNKAGFRDVSRVGFGSGGIGSTSTNGRFTPSEPVAHGLVDNSRFSEGGGDGSLSTPAEAGREPSPPEITERPKLKLLPRSKPLEKVETPKPESENVVGYEESSRKVLGLSDSRQQQPEVPYVEAPKRESDETDEEGNRRVERPKLNLKPRSQVPEAEPADGSEKVRQLVFGGARPRELVLKERGVDDVVDVAPDVALSPGIASLPAAPASSGTKMEPSKIERLDSRSEDKHENRSGRYERPDRSYERQGSHRVDRQDSGRADRGLESKWDQEKDNQWDQERPDNLRRRAEFDRQDSRRDTDSRSRDIDKQESWRRPAESPASAVGAKNSGSALSSLVDPSPRGSGRSGYGSTASAVELAQVYSRSTSIGSTMTGPARVSNNNLRTPLSPIPKGSVQGFAPGYGNGTASRDAPFSRLAEASPPPYSASNVETFGSDFGLDSQGGYFGSGKLGGYPSSDLKRGSSFGRAEIGRDFMEENGDFPGKRGLPVRQRDGYFD